MKQVDFAANKQRKVQQLYQEQLYKKEMAKKEKRDILIFITGIGLCSMALAVIEVFLR